MLQFKTHWSAALQLHILLGATLLMGTAPIARAEDHEKKEGIFLLVCAGDQARKAQDFLAVVNFDDDFLDYGKVIATAPLPEPGATGIEFHHIGLSADGKVVACGGLLSVARLSTLRLANVDPSRQAQPLPENKEEVIFHAIWEAPDPADLKAGWSGIARARVAFDR